jgi:hypothetical protein
MNRFEDDFTQFRLSYPTAVSSKLPSGSHLVELPGYQLPSGWDAPVVTILFLAPAAYPAAQPDCFWMEPAPIRFGGGQTPQNSNDSNLIPEVGARGTWFSWHVQAWDPNVSSLMTFFNVIKQRLNPPR